MNHLLPKAIKADDSASGWSFTLYFLGECLRKSKVAMSRERAVLMLMLMDYEAMVKGGAILRPYDRYRKTDSGELDLWCLHQFEKGDYEQSTQLLSFDGMAYRLNAESTWMLDSTDYSNRSCLLGSTSKFTDEIMAQCVSEWLSLSAAELNRLVKSRFGDLSDQWHSLGDVITSMQTEEAELREYLLESWTDRVAINAAFRNL